MDFRSPSTSAGVRNHGSGRLWALNKGWEPQSYQVRQMSLFP
jgi:hypothetical protein